MDDVFGSILNYPLGIFLYWIILISYKRFIKTYLGKH